MKRRFTVIESLVLLGIASIVAAILSPVVSCKREIRCGPSCASNLKQLGLALTQYQSDYGGRLPPASFSPALSSAPLNQSPIGWADAVFSYAKSSQLLHCPLYKVQRPTDAARRNFSDYYFNRNLSARIGGEMREPHRILLLGEGNDGRDLSSARYARSRVPPTWASDESSPLHRHERWSGVGGHVLFLDGHVKYLKVGAAGRATFTPG